MENEFDTEKNNVISNINKKVVTLTDEERESIDQLLDYHAHEPMAAAERISDLLKVDYQAIFDLL